MSDLLPRILRDIARWGLLIALFFAPWAFGSTRPWAIEWLCEGLAALLACRVLALFFPGGRYRHTPIWLGGAILVILVLGWFMTWNAVAIADPSFAMLAPLQAPLPSLPGAADGALALSWMIRLSLMLGVTLLVAEMAGESVWRLRLWTVVALAGGSIAALGIIQRAAAAPTIFWEDPMVRGDPGYTKNFFASFYYHANAGAYLNLCLPAALGLVLKGFARPTAGLLQALAISNAVVLVLGCAMNTSRAAQVLALGVLAAMALWPARSLLAAAWARQRNTVIVGSAIVGVAIIVIVGGVGLDRQLERWRETSQQLDSGGLLNTRLLAQQAATRAIPDAGLMGFGPGCFRVIFPYYTGWLGERIVGFWRFLHADYLQTLLEWGIIGTAAWSVVFFGGIWRGFRRERLLREERSSQSMYLLPACVIGLLSVGVHALIDFPLQIASIQLTTAVLLGLCWGWSDGLRAPRRQRRRRSAPAPEETDLDAPPPHGS